jgi:hypothetical protein
MAGRDAMRNLIWKDLMLAAVEVTVISKRLSLQNYTDLQVVAVKYIGRLRNL